MDIRTNIFFSKTETLYCVVVNFMDKLSLTIGCIIGNGFTAELWCVKCELVFIAELWCTN